MFQKDMQGTVVINAPSRGCKPEAEFIDPVRELKPALQWVEVGLKGGYESYPPLTLLQPHIKLALTPVQDL
jgi:hypothetical protein